MSNFILKALRDASYHISTIEQLGDVCDNAASYMGANGIPCDDEKDTFELIILNVLERFELIDNNDITYFRDVCFVKVFMKAVTFKFSQLSVSVSVDIITNLTLSCAAQDTEIYFAFSGKI